MSYYNQEIDRISELEQENEAFKAEVELLQGVANADQLEINSLQTENHYYKEAVGACECMSTGVGVFEQKEKAEAERDRLREKYNDLIMQVVNVVTDESRHESAKRIIHNHENQDNEECSALNHDKSSNR